MFFHRETSSLKINKLNVIIWVWLFACSHHATTWHNICSVKPARQLLTWHDMTCNMLWMRYPGCSTKTNPSTLWMRYPGSSTSFINISWNKHLRMHIMIHDIWMKSSPYLTTLSSLNQDASGEGNSREIFQTLNPKLQIIKVACNSQLLKSSSSSHATLTASFSFSSSKPSLHLGLSRSSTICGCDTWIQSQPKAIPRKTSSFLKSIQLLLNSRTVWDPLPGWIMRDI